jgi:hypothetical protein
MTAAIDLAELQRLVQAVEPAALFLPSRLLRRIIKYDRGVPGFGLVVPHRRSLVISRDSLLRIITPEECAQLPQRDLPATLILIACPNPATLAATPRTATLLKFWRTLFHTHVHRALEQRFTGPAGTQLLRDRIQQLGQAAFAEIRTVLQKEDYLLPPRDDRETYVEFAAVYLELRYFARPLLASYFPGLDTLDSVDSLLAQDLDADALWTATRLPGAPDPVIPAETRSDDDEAPPLPAGGSIPPSTPNYRLLKKWKRLAKKATADGNIVRAALSWRQAVEVAAPKQVQEFRTAARTALEQFGERLRAALDLLQFDPVQWRKALSPLLKPAMQGFWPVEARLLYDLQRVCVDHERELYAIDLVQWALALGRRPLKRPVPCQREFLKLRHLRSAVRRLRRARIGDHERARLNELLGAALHHAEDRLRVQFRPLVRGALTEVGLVPRNLPERVAQNKLIEELLDRISDRGFLSLGDLRDSLSRNGLKLPDLCQAPAEPSTAPNGIGAKVKSLLCGVRKFFLGDPLIRADRRLALALDGVYRRGEIYLRWLQRLSSVPFATVLGRLVTLYLVLPFGTAFVALEGVQHIVGPLTRLLTGTHVQLLHPEIPVPIPGRPHPLHVSVPVIVAGIFIFGLLHSASFRRLVGWTLRSVYRGLHTLVVEWPARLLQLPAVRAVLESRPFRFLLGYVFKPLLAAVPVYLALRGCGVEGVPLLAGTGAVFATASLFLNTRLGRDLEELLTDAVVRTWQHLSFALIPALLRFILAVFRQLVEGIDRWLYRVDEWLRFRKGEGRLSVVAKPVLGFFWFFVTYLVRVCVNLFIEPTINPIKHFPVVTVAGKLLGPFYPLVLKSVSAQLLPLGTVVAWGVAWTTVIFMPGFFGFLVWEFKENWKLYEANRPRKLGPVLIGHHGETMLRLLRPGFHSGTIPKLWTKLRRAERAAFRGRGHAAARKRHEELHHVVECLRHFFERELILLLNESGRLDGGRPTLGAVRLSTNRITVVIEWPGSDQGDLELWFEELAGWLVVGVHQPGWSAVLDGPQRWALEMALAGLYKKAGVDLVREQVEAVLGAVRWEYSIVAEGIRLDGDTGSQEKVCSLTEEPASPGQACSPEKLLYRGMPFTWSAWVIGWEAGGGQPEISTAVAGLKRVLPLPDTREAVQA